MSAPVYPGVTIAAINGYAMVGLVDDVAPRGQGLTRALERLIHDARTGHPRQMLAAAREGVAAFLSKRVPQ